METIDLRKKRVPEVKFAGFDCYVVISTYNTGGHAIILTDTMDGEQVAVATINVPIAGLIAPDEVVIKDYSENEGLLEILVEAGVISKPLTYVSVSRFVEAPVCKLLIENNSEGYDAYFIGH